MKFQRLLLVPILLISSACAGATPQYYQANVSVCFAPDGDCTTQIVDQINQAQKSIYMQGYSFTSGSIAHALVRAHKRGVDVKVILDKTNFDCDQFSFGSLLIRDGIPVWDDYTPNIAHNKVMIFDDATVETGSFNFTKAAQKYNAENAVFIESKSIADLYTQNWDARERVSKAVKKDACRARHYY